MTLLTALEIDIVWTSSLPRYSTIIYSYLTVFCLHIQRSLNWKYRRLGAQERGNSNSAVTYFDLAGNSPVKTCKRACSASMGAFMLGSVELRSWDGLVVCTESQVWERRRWILPAEAGLVDRAIGEAEGEGYGRDRPGPYLLLLTSALTPCFIVSRQFFLEGPRDHFLLYISSVSIRCPRQHRSYPCPSRSIYQRLSRPVCFLLSLRFIMQVPLPKWRLSARAVLYTSTLHRFW